MVVVGVMVSPSGSGHATRAAARRTWMHGLDVTMTNQTQRVVARFVLGRHHAACNSTQLARELARHDDLVLVDAPDCRKWHSPEKVHRWFQYAMLGEQRRHQRLPSRDTHS